MKSFFTGCILISESEVSVCKMDPECFVAPGFERVLDTFRYVFMFTVSFIVFCSFGNGSLQQKSGPGDIKSTQLSMKFQMVISTCIKLPRI